MKDLRLDCDCQDPFCFVCLRWEKEYTIKNTYPEEITVFFQGFNGGLWQRIKTAMKLIFRGEWKQEANVCLIGPENLDKIKAWCNECLEERDGKTN